MPEVLRVALPKRVPLAAVLGKGSARLGLPDWHRNVVGTGSCGADIFLSFLAGGVSITVTAHGACLRL